MSRPIPARDFIRWLLVPIAAFGAYVLVRRAHLFLLFSPFPAAILHQATGFASGLLVILAGACVAPTQRLPTATILFIVHTAVLPIAFWGNLAWAFAGSLSAIAQVTAWERAWETSRGIRYTALGVAGLGIVALGIVYAYWVDWPARHGSMPQSLNRALGTNASSVTACYVYDRGGFIDHEWLWRIDADPEAITAFITSAKLQPAPDVPKKFLTMPPYYWPRSLPTGATAYTSAHFSADTRGPDGEHFFLVHDARQGRAYVWCKGNF